MEWRLLRDVPAEEVQRLLSLARRRRFSRGDIVFHRDDPADSVHLVIKGRFAIRVATARGEAAMIAVRGPGDNFGEMALVEPGRRRAATVVALEEGETFAVYQPDFERLRTEHPTVNTAVSAFLAGEVRMLNERLLDALFLPADRRVFRRLRELIELYRDGDDAPVSVPLTQEELAELAGTSRTTVNRALRREEERGTLELRRGSLVVRDPAAIVHRGR
jgi:CRP/FNR family cyclic AMP-dependent transcriptional regulator